MVKAFFKFQNQTSSYECSETKLLSSKFMCAQQQENKLLNLYYCCYNLFIYIYISTYTTHTFTNMQRWAKQIDCNINRWEIIYLKKTIEEDWGLTCTRRSCVQHAIAIICVPPHIDSFGCINKHSILFASRNIYNIHIHRYLLASIQFYCFCQIIFIDIMGFISSYICYWNAENYFILVLENYKTSFSIGRPFYYCRIEI